MILVRLRKYDGLSTIFLLMCSSIYELLFSVSIEFLLFYTILFPALQSLLGINPRDRFLAFAFSPWFDLQYVLDNDTIVQYACNIHLSDSISLFALEYNEFWAHTSVSDSELEPSKYSQWSAEERLVYASAVHRKCLRVGSCYRKRLVSIFSLHAQMTTTPFVVDLLWR